jgi:TonB-dependent receptor
MSSLRTCAILFSSASLLALAHTAAATEAGAAAPEPQEVVVTAPREEVKARAVQYDAPNLVNVQSAETIAKYPDFNAAEALGRIPGVSLSSDTGEGRFVNIRGIDANLNGATYGGVVLLNTNPGGTAAGGGGRAVEFDTIPTGAINGIVVIKTGLPDHEAEGLGGSVELSPRTAAGITKPFVDAQVGWGDEPLHGHSGPFDAEGAVGARFGFDSGGLLVEGDGRTQPIRTGWISNPTPFSFVLTGSTRQDRRGVDDIEESYIDDGKAPSNAVSEYDLRRYDYHRRRYGYGGELDFQPNENHSYYARVDIAGYNEAVHKNFLLFKNLDGVEGDDGSIPANPADPKGFLVTTTPSSTLTDEQEAHRNQIYVVGGKDQFGEMILDYHLAYSRATFRENYNIGATFTGPKNTPLTYDNVTPDQLPVFSFPSGINLNTASLYNLSKLSASEDYDADEERTYAVNLLFPLHLINDNDRVKIGGQARIRDKVATEYDETENVPALNLADASTPGQFFYDGRYPDGPFINRYAIRQIVTANAAPPVFNPGSFFEADENIYAGYLQYTTQIGKLGVLAGVRVENTQAKYTGYIQTTDPAGDTVNTLNVRNENYTNAFPTVQLKYAVTPKLLLRATYSTGISRPGFNQNTVATSVDQTSSPVLITEGNPNLKPTTGQNFDLDLEYYLPQGGIFEAGLFDKEFTNYIVTRIQNGVSGNPFAGGDLANITTFENISSAYARGIEAAYHQKFIFLPKPLDGFGIEANATLVDSHILEYTAAQSLTGKDESGLLPGTSQLTWNVAGFYEANRINARLSAEYVSHSLFGLGGDKALDTIQDDRLTLDFTSAYQIDNHFSFYFNAKNLLNTPLRYYEGEPDRPIQREFYDVTIEGGIKAHF